MKDFNQKVNDLFKGLYEGEFKRKDELDKILSFPVTLVTLQGGTAFFILKQHVEKWGYGWDIYSVLFTVFFGFFVVAIATIICYMVAVFHGPGRIYMHLPYANRIDAFRQQLVEYHTKPSGGIVTDVYYDGIELKPIANVDETALLNDFNQDLQKRYQECSTRNAEINDKRNEFYT